MQNILLKQFLEERKKKYKNGIYHYTQVNFSYNSNHIEGSTLSEEQTRYIYDRNSFLANENQIINTNDILEAKNHFLAFDFILDSVFEEINETYIKKLHSIVKNNCSDIEIIGDFKQRQNYVGDLKTSAPHLVKEHLEKLFQSYKVHNIEDIIDFHFHFEKIHPFEDGNGRVGRLLMFKECLKNNITPFIVDEEHKLFYYRGLKNYENQKGFLIDTCLSCQDKYKEVLNYFQIAY
ncbi:Fic family protein [Campylobacter coli]